MPPSFLFCFKTQFCPSFRGFHGLISFFSGTFLVHGEPLLASPFLFVFFQSPQAPALVSFPASRLSRFLLRCPWRFLGNAFLGMVSSVLGRFFPDDLICFFRRCPQSLGNRTLFLESNFPLTRFRATLGNPSPPKFAKSSPLQPKHPLFNFFPPFPRANFPTGFANNWSVVLFCGSLSV